LQTLTLVNNAGLLPAIAPLGELEAADLARALRVDLEAPMLLTSAFLAATAGWTAARKVLNISSGLGRRAMASQAAYCAAKAGMDHFTRCVALEEAGKPNGARVCSLAPGVIDTDMQVQLRGADSARFPDVGNFIGMKDKGLLTSPQEAAARLLAWLARPDFGATPVADVRDA
jgi:benzil reductase ((S)-benzoin forming)